MIVSVGKKSDHVAGGIVAKNDALPPSSRAFRSVVCAIQIMVPQSNAHLT